MIAIVPSTARGTPPETGASTIRIPRSDSVLPKSIVPIGAEDDISTKTDPSAIPSAIPPSPRTASATITPFGRQVNTASASCPTAANPFAGRAVSCSVVKASTADWLRSPITTSFPARARLAAIGPPIFPIPTYPTRIFISYRFRHQILRKPLELF